MMNVVKVRIVSTFCILIFFTLSFQIGEHSRTTGAPPSSTDAPGERNCTTSGCHDDYSLNLGAGQPFINYSNDSTAYVPGQEYTLEVGIQKDSIQRFGFEITALSEKDTTPAGGFLIADSARTQIMNGITGMEDREYVTYTFYGTNPVDTGRGAWTVNWQAPADDIGPVTFYLATLAANNDGAETGDKAYTTTLTVYPKEGTGYLNQADLIRTFSLYPNPTSGKVKLNFSMRQTGEVTIQLIDLSGKVWLNRLSRYNKAGHHSEILAAGALPAGIYILELTTSSGTNHKKLIIH